jgi:hypothetical protein
MPGAAPQESLRHSVAKPQKWSGDSVLLVCGNFILFCSDPQRERRAAGKEDGQGSSDGAKKADSRHRKKLKSTDTRVACAKSPLLQNSHAGVTADGALLTECVEPLGCFAMKPAA